MIEPVAIIAKQFPAITIPLINEAKHSIDIIVFDWRWYPTVGGSSISQFNAAITAAARRSVAVRAIVNNQGVIDKLKTNGCDAKSLHSKRMLHTKMLLIDGTKLVIGSHNYTQHGFTMNEEASVLVEFPTENNDFKQYFERLWGV